MVREHVKNTRPELVILENVLGLRQKDPETGRTDVGFIQESFELGGYQSFDRVVNATDYGSSNTRARVFLTKILHESADEAGTAQMYDQILSELRIQDPHPVDAFVEVAEQNATDILRELDLSPPPRAERRL